MTTRTIAEERLLDIALEEVLTAAPGAAPRMKLLVAALFLCGIGVVATMLWQGPSAALTPAQQPQRALPKPVRANDADELSRLPANTTNLEVRFASGVELQGLMRFRDLRRLLILPPVAAASPTDAAAWAKYQSDLRAARERFADPHALAPLGTLQTLEDLEVSHGIPLSAEHLACLRNLKLRSLGIQDVDLRSATMRDALLAAPSFRSLRLTMSVVDAALLGGLEPLRLDRLELLACPGLDDAAWAAIGKLRTLRHLEVTNQNDGGCSVGGQPQRLGTLGDAAFDALAALPELRHLGLDESHFPGDLLARLPTSLVSLDLGDRPMNPGEARSLRRLTALRELTFGCGLDEDTATSVLPAWSLERLDYRGHAWGRPLLESLAAQPGLTELALQVSRRTDLKPLAAASHLRMLELRGKSWDPSGVGIALAQVESLAACKELRTLRLRDSGLDAQGVRQLFAGNVAVEVLTTQ